MKEIRMDFEVYEKEMQSGKDSSSFYVLWTIANWLQGTQSLNSCLFFDDATNAQISRIASLLNRGDELKNNEIESIKNEEEEDVSIITKYA